MPSSHTLLDHLSILSTNPTDRGADYVVRATLEADLTREIADHRHVRAELRRQGLHVPSREPDRTDTLRRSRRGAAMLEAAASRIWLPELRAARTISGHPDPVPEILARRRGGDSPSAAMRHVRRRIWWWVIEQTDPERPLKKALGRLLREDRTSGGCFEELVEVAFRRGSSPDALVAALEAGVLAPPLAICPLTRGASIVYTTEAQDKRVPKYGATEPTRYVALSGRLLHRVAAAEDPRRTVGDLCERDEERILRIARRLPRIATSTRRRRNSDELELTVNGRDLRRFVRELLEALDGDGIHRSLLVRAIAQGVPRQRQYANPGSAPSTPSSPARCCGVERLVAALIDGRQAD